MGRPRKAGTDYTVSNDMKIIRANGQEIEIGNPSHDDETKRENARRAIERANQSVNKREDGR